MTAPSITCPTCGRVSHNAGDISNKYCGACGAFHEDPRPDPESWLSALGWGFVVAVALVLFAVALTVW